MVGQFKREIENLSEDIALLDDELTGLETRLKRLRDRLAGAIAFQQDAKTALENVDNQTFPQNK